LKHEIHNSCQRLEELFKVLEVQNDKSDPKYIKVVVYCLSFCQCCSESI